MTKSVGIITLGCDKNRVDTEKMLYYLGRGGFDITNDYSDAQVIIINTCAFIESARKEAIDIILAAAEHKKLACEKLIVTGCLPQKHSAELKEGLPEVDCFLGTNEYERICDVIHELYGQPNAPIEVKNDSLQRIVTTPIHYAYLRIADGCDNHCTFCTIPSIRGKYRSVPVDALVTEAKALVDNGAKELILVAQDVTKYGVDLYGSPSLVRLLKALSETDVCTLRLMYCYPEQVDDELISEIVSNHKIAKYVDIPIQHVDDSVLKRMNRRSTGEQIKTLFSKLRKNSIAVRTTVMVGFPGETEENFKALYDFVAEYAPEHVGVFAYSKEEGTPSVKLKGHLPKKIKSARVKAIGELHRRNREKYNKSLIGKTLRVLYEGIDYDKSMFVGRTDFDAPEIDTVVYFTAKFVEVGEYYNVKITGFDGYDLIGEKTDEFAY